MRRSAPLTRKAPLKARTPLKQGAPLQRKVAVRKRDPERVAKKTRRNFGPDLYREWFHESLMCCVPGCGRVDVQQAHVVHTRGMGGAGGRWYETAPLCPPHHTEQEGRTPAFDAKYGLNLESVAAATALRWMQTVKPGPHATEDEWETFRGLLAELAWQRDRETIGPRGPV